MYLSVPSDSFAPPVPVTAPEVMRVSHDEQIDDKEMIVVGNHKVDLPLYHLLTQIQERKEVFAFSPPSVDTLHVPISMLHSFTESAGGQRLLTIWDSAALLSMVPLSTVRALGLSFTPGSDISFMVANGTKMATIGFCTDMQFSFPNDSGHCMFGDKVYVVDTTPFKLLLGVRFLHRHWGGIFLPWARIALLKPTRVDIQGSVSRPLGATPLHSEIIDDLRLTEEDDMDDVSEVSELLLSVPLFSTTRGLPAPQAALEVGKRDLIAELDGPVLNDFNADVPSKARVSRDFVSGIFKFGTTCPPDIVNKAIDLVLAHWNQFSWHKMDLGCISDVPYDTKYVDHSPCVCKSRRHNYADCNAVVIAAKSQPLIELGVYKRATLMLLIERN